MYTPPPFPLPERFFRLGDACALDAREASTRNSAEPRRPPSVRVQVLGLHTYVNIYIYIYIYII